MTNRHPPPRGTGALSTFKTSQSFQISSSNTLPTPGHLTKKKCQKSKGVWSKPTKKCWHLLRRGGHHRPFLADPLVVTPPKNQWGRKCQISGHNKTRRWQSIWASPAKRYAGEKNCQTAENSRRLQENNRDTEIK